MLYKVGFLGVYNLGLVLNVKLVLFVVLVVRCLEMLSCGSVILIFCFVGDFLVMVIEIVIVLFFL